MECLREKAEAFQSTMNFSSFSWFIICKFLCQCNSSCSFIVETLIKWCKKKKLLLLLILCSTALSGLLAYHPSALSERVQELHAKVVAFVEEHIYPNEKEMELYYLNTDQWEAHPLVEELKVSTKDTRLKVSTISTQTGGRHTHWWKSSR